MNQQTRYGLIGCASDWGGLLRGAAKAPATLRAAGLAALFNRLQLDWKDYGDFSVEQGSQVLLSQPANSHPQLRNDETTIKNLDEVFAVCKLLAEQTEAIVNDNRIPIVIGGDHSISLGSVAGIVNAYRAHGKKLGLLWVDAHADVNSPAESTSHCAFGMPVGCMVGRFPGALSSLCNYQPMINPEDVVWIGLRDVDQPESDFIRKHSRPQAHDSRCFTMTEIDRRGIGAVIESAMHTLSDHTDGFIVSFDLDVCDPNFAPGTGTPKRGGLTFREAHLVLECAYETGKMVGFEMVELNPGLDRDDQTAELALSLLESALGKTIL